MSQGAPRAPDGVRGLFAGLILGLLWAAPLWAGPVLEPVAQLRWQAARAEFGGLSGLVMGENGHRIWAVSDRGTLFSAPVIRSEDGVPQAFGPAERHLLYDTRGAAPRAFLANAEAMVSDGAGGFYVAYEAWARVWHYAQPGAVPTWTHEWDRFWDRLGNEGFEALARDGAGRLHVISESAGEDGFPVFVQEDGTWAQAFTLPARDAYRISGADFGPDGALYVVERRFSWFGGFATRIRRYHLRGHAVGAEELLLDDATGTLGNSEGIDVWHWPGDGGLRVSLISDDNFSPLQETVMSEFRLVE